MTPKELVAKLRSSDDRERSAAWYHAGPLGPGAIATVAPLLEDANPEVARCAGRAITRIVDEAGRPTADAERRRAAAALIELLRATRSLASRRLALSLLPAVAGEQAVKPMAALLSDPELRDDARMALEALPVSAAVAALQATLQTAPADFKPNLALALRRRGVSVADVADLRHDHRWPRHGQRRPRIQAGGASGITGPFRPPRPRGLHVYPQRHARQSPHRHLLA
jgi:hypothetical protein